MFYSDKDIDAACKAFSADDEKRPAKEKNLVRLEATKWLDAYQEEYPGMFEEKAYPLK
jgi:hypothetical protein